MKALAQFTQAIIDAGLPRPEKLVADGNVHALNPGGWYILRRGPVAAGGFGSWHLGLHRTWCEKPDDELTPEERIDLQRWIRTTRRQRGVIQRLEIAAAASTVGGA